MSWSCGPTYTQEGLGNVVLPGHPLPSHNSAQPLTLITHIRMDNMAVFATVVTSSYHCGVLEKGGG